jgi:AmmeMemoRadiSam system protein A
MIPDDAGGVLLPLARAAIADGLRLHHPKAAATASWLEEEGATFVTLTERARLRGCIGTLQAWRPVGRDVVANAHAAAFRDRRFDPVQAEEFEALRIEVSLLSDPESMSFASEADALAQLRPGVDGVILNAGPQRATFLPQVWDELPAASDFMAHLKRKAGLSAGYWGDDVLLERYSVTKWKEPR